MKKLLLLLLFPFFASAQLLPGVVSSASKYPGNSEGGGKTYTAIPDPPTFMDSHTLLQSVTGNAIQIGDTGGKTELKIGSDYPLFQLNGLSGLYKIQSELATGPPSVWATLGQTGQAAGINSAVSTPSVEYYNVHLINANNTAKMAPAVSVQTQLYQNVIIENSLFAGLLINESVATENYGDLTLNLVRTLNTGGEGRYLGNTGNEVTTYLGITTITDNYSYNTGREGIQCNGHADLRINHATIINAGLDTGSGIGQNNWAQFQNIYTGYIKNFLAVNCRAPGMFATEDFTFENGLIDWNEPDREIYLQDMVANGYTKNTHVGGTVKFKNVIFRNPDYTKAWVFRIQDEGCNYVFEDCTFPTAAIDIYKDERTSFSYTITVINPTFDDSTPLPTFIPSPDIDYIGYETVVGDDYWYNRGCGARTPGGE